MSKQGDNLKRWKAAIPKLIEDFNNKDIYGCELRLDKKCTGRLFCGFAHRYPRVWYVKHPELLTDFRHIVCACSSCHEKLDHFYDQTGKDEIFNDLRQ